MSEREEVTLQRAFYQGGAHDHLQPRAQDAYATKLAGCVARAAGMTPSHRVLEVGAGFGRFSFDLLAHCGTLTALDLSPRALETLARERDARGIPEARCRTHCGDVDSLAAGALGEGDLEGGFDAIVGLFILHHLPDVPGTLARLTPLLRPGGRLVFLEPNRRNPLFLFQVACCADMSWREEKGMFTLSARGVGEAMGAAGLDEIACERRGFFPPQLFNRSPRWRELEAGLERRTWLRGWLPFLVMSGRRPEP